VGIVASVWAAMHVQGGLFGYLVTWTSAIGLVNWIVLGGVALDRFAAAGSKGLPLRSPWVAAVFLGLMGLTVATHLPRFFTQAMSVPDDAPPVKHLSEALIEWAGKWYSPAGHPFRLEQLVPGVGHRTAASQGRNSFCRSVHVAESWSERLAVAPRQEVRARSGRQGSRRIPHERRRYGASLGAHRSVPRPSGVRQKYQGRREVMPTPRVCGNFIRQNCESAGKSDSEVLHSLRTSYVL